MRKLINKGVLSVLTGGLVSVFLVGCASMSQYTSFFPFGLEAPEKNALHIRPSRNSADSYYKIGIFYQDRKEYAMAAESFHDAVRVDPKFFEAYNSLGVCYDQMKMYKEAVNAYQEAILLHPDRDEVLNNLGYSQLLQGDFDAAVKSFTTAIDLNQVNNRRYYNNLGLAYMKKSQYAEAYRAFVAAGGAEKARRNIVALAPSPKIGHEFLLANNLDGDTNYQSAEKALPRHKDTLTKQSTLQQAIPVKDPLTTNQLDEPLQPEPFVVSLHDSGKKDEAVVSLAPKEDEKPSVDSLDSLAQQAVAKEAIMTKPVAVDPLLVAARALEVSALPITDESPQQVPKSTFPPPESDIIATPVIKRNSDTEAHDNSKKIALRSLSKEPFVIELAPSSKTGTAVAVNLGRHLSGHGFTVQLSPHKLKYYGKTTIYYGKASLQEAYQLAQSIPGYQDMKQEDFGRSKTQLRVMLGEDIKRLF
jgi:tetratricopeptide (TPR) repeat protein